MKKLVYSFVIVSVVLLALFTVGQLSTAQNKSDANSESDNQKALQEANRPQTGDLTNGFTHTGVLQVGLTDIWAIPGVVFNQSITVRLGEVAGGGADPNFFPRLRLIDPNG